MQTLEQELDFQGKLGRTTEPHETDEAKTQIFDAETTDKSRTPVGAGTTAGTKRQFIFVAGSIILLFAAGIFGYRFFVGDSNTKQIESIAVLPFVNESGNAEVDFAELDKAFENRETLITQLKVDPRLDPLGDDRRFQDLLRRVGLPQ